MYKEGGKERGTRAGGEEVRNTQECINLLRTFVTHLDCRSHAEIRRVVQDHDLWSRWRWRRFRPSLGGYRSAVSMTTTIGDRRVETRRESAASERLRATTAEEILRPIAAFRYPLTARCTTSEEKQRENERYRVCGLSSPSSRNEH